MSKLTIKIHFREQENDWDECIFASGDHDVFYYLVTACRGVCDHFRGIK